MEIRARDRPVRGTAATGAARRAAMTPRGWAELLAIVAPPACLACREPLGRADDLVCGDCLRALPWLRRGCPHCGLPRHRRGGCPAADAAFDRAWSPMAYDGPARALVGALKFRAALPAAGLMAAQMTATLPSGLRDGVARELVAALKFRAALPVATLMAAHVAANLPADLRAVARAVTIAPP
ncbi:MAG TPA: double zinc ribbon domain-containing protein, partial [Thermoleophilaceae bacterium]|nr:double zinc ribbon domain-containing protein [Thermoleophilaceae bacterium]